MNETTADRLYDETLDLIDAAMKASGDDKQAAQNILDLATAYRDMILDARPHETYILGELGYGIECVQEVWINN